MRGDNARSERRDAQHPLWAPDLVGDWAKGLLFAQLAQCVLSDIRCGSISAKEKWRLFRLSTSLQSLHAKRDRQVGLSRAGPARITLRCCGDRNSSPASAGGQALAQERWIIARQARVLPVRHFHVVFTLPIELRYLGQWAPKPIFTILFRLFEVRGFWEKVAR